MRILLVSALALAVVACKPAGGESASSAVGDWSVDGDQSSLAFVTTKNGEVSESHVFNTIGGGVKADGTATITVDLASVNTANETRDGRMKEKLFQVQTYPNATVTAKLNPGDFESMAVGERKMVPVTLNLDLHGAKADLDEAQLFVTRVADNKMLVETTRPILVSSEDFGLMEGLAELQSLASLKSIQPMAPVTFSVLFTR